MTRQLCCLLTSVLLALSVAAEPPQVFHSRNPWLDIPIWIPRAEALDARGELHPGVLGTHGERMAEMLAEMRQRDLRRGSDPNLSETPELVATCFGERPAEIFKPDRTLGDLVASSVAIFSGTVESVQPGFFEGFPASLLMVSLTSQHVEPDTYDTSSGRIYVYYPQALFKIGREIACMRPATHPARPKAGDRIIAFALDTPVDTSRLIVYPQASQHLIFETKDGELLLPRHLRESLAGFSTIDALLQRIEYDIQRSSATEPRKP